MKIIDQKFSQNVINDIFEWDIANWSQSLNLWEPAIDQYLKNKKNVVALDLGSRHGGTSLYFALKNIKCVCSNSKEIFSKAKKLHQKYGVQDLISYEIINIKNIPYENKFDIICFKSVIGAVGKDKDYKNQKLAIEQISKALKPGGILVFAENLRGSSFNYSLKRKFSPGTEDWNYLEFLKLDEIFRPLKMKALSTSGVFCNLLPSEKLRNFFAPLDQKISKYLSSKSHYFAYGVAQK